MLLAMTFFAILASRVAASDADALLSASRGITNKPSSWRPDVGPCLWQGVGCDATGNVTKIDWGSLGLGGYANLTLLPRGLKELDLYFNNLTGVPDLGTLPLGARGAGFVRKCAYRDP